MLGPYKGLLGAGIVISAHSALSAAHRTATQTRDTSRSLEKKKREGEGRSWGSVLPGGRLCEQPVQGFLPFPHPSRQLSTQGRKIDFIYK